MNTYPRETVETVRLGPVTVNGVVTTNYTISVVEEHERPTSWVAPVDVTNPAGKGFTISGLTRGEYVVYVKASGVVIEAGRFEIT